jgi:hypothetical protein
MKGLKYVVILFFMLFLFSQASLAQIEEDTLRYRIETTDGNQYIGTILFQDQEITKFRTESIGEITILNKDIISRTLIDDRRVVGGRFWFDNPQATRYFYMPNGYGLKKGEGYYQNVWILFNQVAVGITDNISIGAGLVPLFLFAGTPTPFWLTPKFSVPVVKDKFNVGAGALLGTVFGEGRSGFGVLYGLSTLGTVDKNITLGLGWGFAGGEVADSPTISLSGMIRTGDRGYIISENYYINTGYENLALISFGGRRLIGKVGLDFGLIIPFIPDLESFIAIPWLGLTVPFGSTRGSQRI